MSKSGLKISTLSFTSKENNMAEKPHFLPEDEDGGIVFSIPVPQLPRAYSAPNMKTLAKNGCECSKSSTSSIGGKSSTKSYDGDNKEEKMEMSRQEWAQKYRLHMFVALIFLVTVISVSLSWFYRNKAVALLMSSQTIFFDPRTRLLTLTDPSDTSSVRAHLGLALPQWQLPLHCPVVMRDNPNAKDCLWKERAQLKVASYGDDNVRCYNVSWESLSYENVPYDCIELGSANWYGPSNQSETVFPITGSFVFQPNKFSVGDNGIFSSASDFYWLSSNGAAVLVYGDNPVQILWNTTEKNKLCVMSNHTGPFHNHDNTHVLQYTLCQSQDIISTHLFMKSLFSRVPTPPVSSLHDSYWSLKAVQNDANVTQQDVMDLISKVRDFGGSSITLDGNWQRHHGDLTFDTDRFPNLDDIKETAQLNDTSLTLSVSPHFHYLSDNFKTGVEKSYFVKDAGGNVTGLSATDIGTAASLDIFNDIGRTWFKEKIKKLKSLLGLSSFRLTYEQGAWLPYKPHFHDHKGSPDKYRTLMAECVASVGKSPVVEHTCSSGHVPVLTPVQTYTQVTDGQQCMVNILQTTFTLGLMGYPFIMADGISGPDDKKPSRELYIRWLQLTTFFPARQFSIPPWRYDVVMEETVANLSEWRSELVTPTLSSDSLIEDTARGIPIIRPVWWLDPTNATLHGSKVTDEFLLGPDILIAPIMCDRARSRDIFIPPGIWEDRHDGSFFLGPSTLEDYPVPLDFVAVFFKRTVRGHISLPEL